MPSGGPPRRGARLRRSAGMRHPSSRCSRPRSPCPWLLLARRHVVRQRVLSPQSLIAHSALSSAPSRPVKVLVQSSQAPAAEICVPDDADAPSAAAVAQAARAPPGRRGWCAARGCGPAARPSRRKSSSAMRWPWAAPAAREMFSSISVPPRSLTPACSTWRAPPAPIFTHDAWMLSTSPRVGDAAHGVHEQGLPEGGAPAGLALQVDRRGHVHEGQGHELGEPAGLLLEVPGADMWRAQGTGCSIEPNMIVMFERSPTPWAVRWASSHSSVLILSGQRTARTSSSRISAAVPGRVSARRP